MRSASRALVFLLFLVMPTAALFGLFAACGGSTADTGRDASVADERRIDRARLDEPVVITEVAAGCNVSIETPPLLPSPHVPVGSDVVYNSNPPASGPHYPIWAAFQEFAAPVPRPYYVHDLEHGAIVLLYKCDASGATSPTCDEIQQALRETMSSLPDDPVCTAQNGPAGPARRTVMSPDPQLDVAIAAVAWGWVYKASCIDLASLKKFASDHYNQGTENICANGQTVF
jgi:Protein of unknown function (DUF3105)